MWEAHRVVCGVGPRRVQRLQQLEGPGGVLARAAVDQSLHACTTAALPAGVEALPVGQVRRDHLLRRRPLRLVRAGPRLTQCSSQKSEPRFGAARATACLPTYAP